MVWCCMLSCVSFPYHTNGGQYRDIQLHICYDLVVLVISGICDEHHPRHHVHDGGREEGTEDKTCCNLGRKIGWT